MIDSRFTYTFLNTIINPPIRIQTPHLHLLLLKLAAALLEFLPLEILFHVAVAVFALLALAAALEAGEEGFDVGFDERGWVLAVFAFGNGFLAEAPPPLFADEGAGGLVETGDKVVGVVGDVQWARCALTALGAAGHVAAGYA